MPLGGVVTLVSSEEGKLSLTFMLQCLLTSVVLGIGVWVKPSPSDNLVIRIDNKVLFIIFLLASLLGLLLELLAKKTKPYHFLNSVGNVVELLLLPSAFLAAINLVFLFPMARLQLSSELLGYPAIILFIAALFPLVFVHIQRAQSLGQRILLLILFDIAFEVASIQLGLLSVRLLSNTMIEIIGNLGFILIVGWVMNWWGFKIPDLLKFRLNANVKIVGLIGALAFWIIAIGTSAFSKADSWTHFLSDWSFRMQSVPITVVIATIMGTFIEEWLFRYAILWQLIKHYRPVSKNPVLISAIISSILFGVAHSLNVSNGQSIQSTIFQVIMAIVVGVFLASVYLYTGVFWLSVILHSAADLLSGLLVKGASFTAGAPDPFHVELYGLYYVILLVISFYLLIRRRKTVELTVEQIIDRSGNDF